MRNGLVLVMGQSGRALADDFPGKAKSMDVRFLSGKRYYGGRRHDWIYHDGRRSGVVADFLILGSALDIASFSTFLSSTSLFSPSVGHCARHHFVRNLLLASRGVFASSTRRERAFRGRRGEGRHIELPSSCPETHSVPEQNETAATRWPSLLLSYQIN